jgi:hypothetical protein
LHITTGNNNTYLGTSTNGNATANGQIAIGYQATTTKANECVIGNSALTEIRPMSDTGCDLGTSLFPFKDVYVGGQLYIGGVTGYSFTTTAGLEGQVLAMNTLSGVVEFTDPNIGTNTGSVGEGIYKGKSGMFLEFHKLSTSSDNVNVSFNTDNSVIDIDLNLDNPVHITATETAALQVDGGASIGGTLNFGRVQGRVAETITNTYTMDEDYILNVTGTALVTIPDPISYSGTTYMIIKNTADTVTVTSSGLIVGGINPNDIQLTGGINERVMLVSNGAKWFTM